MNPNLLPTKRNLNIIRRNLSIATQGHNLLDKKHKVILRELVFTKITWKELQNRFYDVLQNAKNMLDTAKSEVGDKLQKKIIESQPLDTSLQITYRSIMGVVIAKVNINKKKYTSPPYTLGESTVSLDEALFAWQNVKILLVKLAEAETAINHINLQLQKARKRAAALKNITIPAYESQIKYISNQLEERERDELARVKAAASKV